MSEVIPEMTAKSFGCIAIVDSSKIIRGIITDGDLRRMLENNSDISFLKASDIMCTTPKIISSNKLASYALTILEQNNISQLVVVDDEKYIGIVHIHDILKEGI